MPETLPASPVAAVTTADEIAAPLAASMPTPTAPAPAPALEPAQAAAPAPAPDPAPAGRLDALGRPFDGTKFKPAFDKAGRWINRNAGRKKAVDAAQAQPAQAAAPTPPPQTYIPPDLLDEPEAPAAPEPAAQPAQEAPPAPAAAQAPASRERYRMLADVYCRGAISAAVGLISDEWTPDNDAEYEALRDAIAAWMEAEGAEDLSPKAAAALAIFAYAMRRVQRPKTLSRFAAWKLALVSWWKGRQAARAIANLPTVTG